MMIGSAMMAIALAVLQLTPTEILFLDEGQKRRGV